PPQASPRRYPRPADVLERGVDYAAVLQTSCGRIEMDLAEDEAPVNVNNFVFLAREGFYDGLTFHRVVEDFVIQAGDPNSDNGVSPDGPGYDVKDELPSGSKEYVFGVVAMANTGQADSAGSQFFIIVHQSPEGETEPAGLEPDYSIIGEVEPASYETLEQIAGRPVKGDQDPREPEEPVNPVYIESLEIEQSSG
ncbi:MAG: peptidylprolyl isomerase, partial [Actinomycetota bacterium]